MEWTENGFDVWSLKAQIASKRSMSLRGQNFFPLTGRRNANSSRKHLSDE